MGQTQSTVGVQKVRAIALMQLLTGNLGNAGGGIAAMRGHSNVQGSTDMGFLYDLLPGYLKLPLADQPDWATYLDKTTPKKVVVMLGGPVMNLLIAAVFMAVIVVGIGLPQYTSTLGAVQECVPADSSQSDCAAADPA